MDHRELYAALAAGVPAGETIAAAAQGARWALAETERGSGLAMFTAGHSRPALFPTGLAGLDVRKAAEAVAGWNLEEAGQALAAVNAACNRFDRAEALGARVGGHYADGIELTGKTVALIGHMKGPAGLREQAKEVCILEREPKEGDFPDAACDWILPRCDLVIITGSSLVNKTLPHLLSLCERATVILTGPSVPLCPALLDFGIDRVSGLIVTDREGLRRRVETGEHGSPFVHGQPFTLCREK
ncbi:MAG: DUF364 domain-containing protein [Oscillospiraceae bacterium]|nr:DUF364 domain-containing protein [Oscillospiraceae bacterium]